MVIEVRPSPARVSAAAAAAFPRRALIALLAIYMVAGLFGRDPWHPEDAAGFGVMWTMAHGAPVDWLLPNVAGADVAEEGPFAWWIGALFIKLFGGWLGDPLAARLTTVLWCVVATASLWYATYHYARRTEAQPVAFVFGGEANARDYGRMLADIAVLLFVGTIGLATRMHETTAETAAIALVGVALFGLSVALERRLAGALVVGLALGTFALTRGPHAALFLGAGVLAALIFTLPRDARAGAIVVSFATALAIFALWPLASLAAPAAARADYFAAWRAWAAESFAFASVLVSTRIARALAWQLWPLWPFSLWAIYAWRHGLAQAQACAHVRAPLMLAAAMLVGSLFAPFAEASLLLLAAPLALLAAFGLVSVRRTAENAIDWFAILVFTFFGLFAWAYYVAMQAGTPPKMAASVARLIPGYAPQFDLAALALAMIASAGWVTLVVWRIRYRPDPLWRGALLAAGGLVMLWVVLMTLFLPAINYNRSYAPLAASIRAEIMRVEAAGACVLAYQLQPSHRALLAYHGGIHFARPQDRDCPLALHRDSRRTGLDDQPPPGDWRVVWEGRWLARPDDAFVLYRRGQL